MSHSSKRPKFEYDEDEDSSRIETLYEMHEKLITRNEAIANNLVTSLEILNKVMEGANKMMDKIVQASENNLEMEQTRLKCLEIETEKKSDVKVESKPYRSYHYQAPKPYSTTKPYQVSKVHHFNKKENFCYRCNKNGHWAKECPLKVSDEWFCYYCQGVRDHKGDECPRASRHFSSRTRETRQEKSRGVREMKT